MVGFVLKNKVELKGGEPKKLGAFSLKGNKNKVTKKPLIKSKLAIQEDDDTIKKIAINTSEDLKLPIVEEVVLKLKPNKTLRGDVVTANEPEQETPKFVEGQPLAFGLNVPTKKDTETKLPVKPASVKSKSLTEQARLSLINGEDFTTTKGLSIQGVARASTSAASANDNEEEEEEPDYSKVAVEDFGLLFLKGLGYKPEQDKKPKSKDTQIKVYGNQKGLGSK